MNLPRVHLLASTGALSDRQHSIAIAHGEARGPIFESGLQCERTVLTLDQAGPDAIPIHQQAEQIKGSRARHRARTKFETSS